MARFRNAMAGAAALTALICGTAGADDLKEALALAYDTNPTLAAERARLRAIDENFVQARSNALPQVTVEGSTQTSNSTTDQPPSLFNPTGHSSSTSGSNTAAVSVGQTLFRGFRTGAAMDRARASIESGRASLISTEQTVLFNAASAYMNVRRDAAIVDIRANNVEVLLRQLEAAQDRFEVGEITRTDVAQAEARLAGARSQLAAAQSNLAVSRANYEQVVGRPAGTLEAEPPLPALPTDLDQAIEAANRNNPDVIAAYYAEEAARASVRDAKGARLPTVSVSAGASRSDGYNDNMTDTESVTFGGRVSVPLYTGGFQSSQIRAAEQTASQARMQLRDTERRVKEFVLGSWSAYIATLTQIDSSREQVRANEIAFEGVEEEARVGLRTTLDVLNAEQELLNARLALVTAERDAYVAGFRLLQAVGGLTARDLGLEVAYYDPAVNFSEVRGRYLGVGLGLRRDSN